MEYINMDKRFKISKILVRNFIFLLLFALLIDKTSSLGFDSASSCSPNAKQSRRGRAQMLATIPCDLTTQAYCALPGAAYPWHAVRRFVHENQGLMKRMYGDVRHISVLRDEMLNNEIDIDDIESASERYSRDGYNHRASKFMHNREEFDNIRTNDVLREPHFRPVTTTSTTTTTSKPSSTANPNSSTNTNESLETTMPANFEEKTTTPRSPTPSDKTITSKVGTTTNEPNTQRMEESEYNSATDLGEQETTKLTDQLLEQQQMAADDKEIAALAEDAGEENILIEFNSVYELDNDSSSPPNALLGDNIEIVESPQLGLGNLTSDLVGSTTEPNSETVVFATTTLATTTTTTTVKPSTTTSTTTTSTPTTAKTETVAERSPAKHHRKPFVPSSSRQRPQQLYKVDSTISAKLKLKMNPTPATPSRTSANTNSTTNTSTTTTIISHNTTVNKGLASSSSTLTAPLSSTKASSLFKGNSNKNYNRYTTLNNNRYGLSSTPTPMPATQAPIAAQPFKGNADLLLGENLRKPVVNSTPATPAADRPLIKEGQLFQDTMKHEPAPVINPKGVNACPVKEEVVAPFWANNTRGEVLALLNLYPFEQYVHWEKCTQEHKQMYCREGCRCEQQYRLHRLLAYDPHNECRGIFSDWFRFPSCCICRCYNIPVDFRATSRSPRAESGGGAGPDYRHPIEVAEEQVKNAIYEHATEDWYRPKDELELY